jgi:hypothetical protein
MKTIRTAPLGCQSDMNHPAISAMSSPRQLRTAELQNFALGSGLELRLAQGGDRKWSDPVAMAGPL